MGRPFYGGIVGLITAGLILSRFSFLVLHLGFLLLFPGEEERTLISALASASATTSAYSFRTEPKDSATSRDNFVTLF